MGYRIAYEPGRRIKRTEKRRNPFLFPLIVFLTAALALISLCWPEGKQFVLSALFPGDAAVTVAALEDMAQKLGEGVPLSETFRQFCLQVLAG